MIWKPLETSVGTLNGIICRASHLQFAGQSIDNVLNLTQTSSQSSVGGGQDRAEVTEVSGREKSAQSKDPKTEITLNSADIQ